MANDFNKEEQVAFESVLEGFNDGLVMSQVMTRRGFANVAAERQNDITWEPMPYISQSHDGANATGNFNDHTQLSVPVTVGIQKHATAVMEAQELRDPLQLERIGRSKAQKLASDINIACQALAADQGTIVVTHPGAASGYDDVAEIDAVMNELGIGMNDRNLGLSSRDYNSMASNLAARETMNEMPTAAYRRSSVGQVASFETLKMDYTRRLGAGTATGVTIDGADQYYTPVATTTASTGEVANKDNRYQTISVTVGGGALKAGDAFTIAGVNSVHHITKEDTAQPKTFRVIEVVNATTIVISPAIVSNGGSTDAEAQYQNVTATPADNAAITLLNTANAAVNPFWHGDSLLLTPGTVPIQPDSGLGVLRATTDQGIELVCSKQTSLETHQIRLRWDVRFGVTNICPEMNGIMLFGQS